MTIEADESTTSDNKHAEKLARSEVRIGHMAALVNEHEAGHPDFLIGLNGIASAYQRRDTNKKLKLCDKLAEKIVPETTVRLLEYYIGLAGAEHAQLVELRHTLGELLPELLLRHQEEIPADIRRNFITTARTEKTPQAALLVPLIPYLMDVREIYQHPQLRTPGTESAHDEMLQTLVDKNTVHPIADIPQRDQFIRTKKHEVHASKKPLGEGEMLPDVDLLRYTRMAPAKKTDDHHYWDKHGYGIFEPGAAVPSAVMQICLSDPDDVEDKNLPSNVRKITDREARLCRGKPTLATAYELYQLDDTPGAAAGLVARLQQQLCASYKAPGHQHFQSYPSIQKFCTLSPVQAIYPAFKNSPPPAASIALGALDPEEELDDLYRPSFMGWLTEQLATSHYDTIFTFEEQRWLHQLGTKLHIADMQSADPETQRSAEIELNPGIITTTPAMLPDPYPVDTSSAAKILLTLLHQREPLSMTREDHQQIGTLLEDLFMKYLFTARSPKKGTIMDSAGYFHLCTGGAYLAKVTAEGNTTPSAWHRGAGIMPNYVYPDTAARALNREEHCKPGGKIVVSPEIYERYAAREETLFRDRYSHPNYMFPADELPIISSDAYRLKVKPVEHETMTIDPKSHRKRSQVSHRS